MSGDNAEPSAGPVHSPPLSVGALKKQRGGAAMFSSWSPASSLADRASSCVAASSSDAARQQTQALYARVSAACTGGAVCRQRGVARHPVAPRAAAAGSAGSSAAQQLAAAAQAGLSQASVGGGKSEPAPPLPPPAPGGSSSLRINAELALYTARVKQWESRRAGGASQRELVAASRAAFARAVLLDPTDGRGYLGLAKCHEREGRWAEARAAYEEGTRATGGENAFLWQAWAVLEARRGDPGRARQLYDAATVADKRHAAAWHGWGMLEKRCGNFQRARDLFTTGLRLVPDSQPKEFLYQSLGVMAAERGRADEARAHFAAGARTPSGRKSPALWQAWALLEQRQARPERARLLYQRALAASPKNRHTWLAWAALEAQLGFAARARELFRQGAALNPRDAALLQAWARFEAASGRLATARALFERAARADPRHQPVWQAWGVTEATAGQQEAARQLFQRGVWADPTSKDAAKCFQAWGVLEERAGDTSLARQLYRAALKLDPASVPTWQAWAQMEERLGAVQRAQELRSLCLQQRAEEAVGLADTSPAELVRPFLDKVSSFFDFSSESGGGASAPASPIDAHYRRGIGAPPAPQQTVEEAVGDSALLLSGKEGVLGLPGLLRPADAAAAAQAAEELDAAVAGATAQSEETVLQRVSAVIATLSGVGAAVVAPPAAQEDTGPAPAQQQQTKVRLSRRAKSTATDNGDIK